MKKLSKERTCRGKTIIKSDAELRCEPKEKASRKYAAQFAPHYSLCVMRGRSGLLNRDWMD
jgi:hypothetical protein